MSNYKKILYKALEFEHIINSTKAKIFEINNESNYQINLVLDSNNFSLVLELSKENITAKQINGSGNLKFYRTTTGTNDIYYLEHDSNITNITTKYDIVYGELTNLNSESYTSSLSNPILTIDDFTQDIYLQSLTVDGNLKALNISTNNLNVTEDIDANNLNVTETLTTKNATTAVNTTTNTLDVTGNTTTNSLTVETTTNTGTMSVSGSSQLNTLDVSGNTTLNNLNATDVTIESAGTLSVSGTATIEDLDATDVNVTNLLTATNVNSTDLTSVNTNITGTMSVTGIATIEDLDATDTNTNTLNVTTNIDTNTLKVNTSTTTESLNVSGLSTLNTLNVTNATIEETGTLNVTGTANIGTLDATDVTIANLDVETTATATTLEATNVTITPTGTLTVSGTTDITNLDATNVDINNNLTVTNNTTTSTLDVHGSSTTGSLNVTNNTTTNTLEVENNTTTGSLNVTNMTVSPTGTLTVSGATNITNLNATNITTDSVETTTIDSDSLNVTNNTTTNSLTVSGNTETNTLEVTTNTDVRGILTVIGNTTTNNLDVNTFEPNNLTVSGSTNIINNLTLDGFSVNNTILETPNSLVFKGAGLEPDVTINGIASSNIKIITNGFNLKDQTISFLGNLTSFEDATLFTFYTSVNTSTVSGTISKSGDNLILNYNGQNIILGTIDGNKTNWNIRVYKFPNNIDLVAKSDYTNSIRGITLRVLPKVIGDNSKNYLATSQTILDLITAGVDTSAETANNLNIPSSKNNLLIQENTIDTNILPNPTSTGDYLLLNKRTTSDSSYEYVNKNSISVGNASAVYVNTTSYDDETQTTTYIPYFLSDSSGNKNLYGDGHLKYDPVSNTLTAITFSGSLSGNATTATTSVNYNTTSGGIKTKFDSIDSSISSLNTNKLNISGGTITGNLSVNGNTTLGNATTDTVTIAGNLVVNGTTTTIDTANLSIEDSQIELYKGTKTSTYDAGFFVNDSITSGIYVTKIGTNSFKPRFNLGTTFYDIKHTNSDSSFTSINTQGIAARSQRNSGSPAGSTVLQQSSAKTGSYNDALFGIATSNSSEVAYYLRVGTNKLQYTIPDNTYNIYHEGNPQTSITGNAATATTASNYTSSGTIKTALDSKLNISGGTITGNLLVNGNTTLGDSTTDVITIKGKTNMPSDLYVELNTYGLNMNNSDIIGVNGLYTQDLANTSGEGIRFYRTSTTTDDLTANNGYLYFNRNQSRTAASGLGKKIYHENQDFDISITKENKTCEIVFNPTLNCMEFKFT